MSWVSIFGEIIGIAESHSYNEILINFQKRLKRALKAFPIKIIKKILSFKVSRIVERKIFNINYKASLETSQGLSKEFFQIL